MVPTQFYRASCRLIPCLLLVGGPVLVLASGSGSSIPTAYSIQLVSPGPTGVAMTEEGRSNQSRTVSITDVLAEVQPGWQVFRGVAKGMRNVAVVCPAGGKWHMAQPNEDGSFTVTVLVPEANGPLPVEIHAWDRNDSTFTTNLTARTHLFVTKGRDVMPAVPSSAEGPAKDMKLVWSDEFAGPLSATGSSERNATWYAGGKPSATGSQYSDAYFTPDYQGLSPFTIRDGFLRIRATHAPDMVDPTGWKRRWWSGHLSTAFPDGTASAAFRKGYAEVRMMMPAGAGTWPAFWLLDTASIAPKSPRSTVEVDVVEGYGHDSDAYMATLHLWPPPGSTKHQEVAMRVRQGGLANAFHRYGIRLTDREAIWYFDDTEVFRRPLFEAETASPFFLMVNLSIGGGWPAPVPPSGYYDLWVDYVRLYE